MPRRIFYFPVLLIISFLAAPQSAAQDNQEAMQQWMAYMQPGKAHEMMAKSVGEWVTKSSFWMSPGAPPHTADGKVVNEMILGGRYLRSLFTSSMMGMPVEGMNIMGFDNAMEEYTSVWIDNLGTGTVVTTGKMDAAAGKLVMYGDMVEPMAKTKLKIKTIWTFGDNLHKMEMFTVTDAGDVKSMEITYSKK